jgi:hypothetical protein
MQRLGVHLVDNDYYFESLPGGQDNQCVSVL